MHKPDSETPKLGTDLSDLYAQIRRLGHKDLGTAARSVTGTPYNHRESVKQWGIQTVEHHGVTKRNHESDLCVLNMEQCTEIYMFLYLHVYF